MQVKLLLPLLYSLGIYNKGCPWFIVSWFGANRKKRETLSNW